MLTLHLAVAALVLGGTMPPPLHPGDLDQSRTVDLLDFARLANDFGVGVGDPLAAQVPYRDADLDADGDIDLADVALFYWLLGGPDPAPQCLEDADCDDGDPCTQDFCDASVCTYSQLPSCCYNDFNCGDFDPCTTTCLNLSGIAPICFFPSRTCCLFDAQCDDRDFCNGLERCDLETNQCYIDRYLDCADSNPCTVDSCDSLFGCVYTEVICDDQNLCTADSCDITGQCTYTPAVDCPPSQVECVVDYGCDAATGQCRNIPVDLYCEDFNGCTDDRCDVNSGCVHTPTNCDDGNACTIDSCVGGFGGGCTHSSLCPTTGDSCNFYECQAGSCVNVVPPNCCNSFHPCGVGQSCQDGHCCWSGFPVASCVVGAPIPCCFGTCDGGVCR